MARPKEKTPKLSDAVQAAVDAHSYLQMPLEMGLINYSALARKLRPGLEKQLGQKLSIEAIAMALHRHIKPDTTATGTALQRIIAECKVHLVPSMAAAHYAYSRKLQEKMHLAKAEIENQGGQLFVVQRTGEMSIITQAIFIPLVKRYAENAKRFALHENQCLITVQFPEEGFERPGVFALLTQTVSQANINIVSIFTSYSKISFLVSDDDAQTAYERIMRTIATAKTML